jgi:hypothetical protein
MIIGPLLKFHGTRDILHADGHERKSTADRRRKRGGADNETVDRGRDSTLV